MLVLTQDVLKQNIFKLLLRQEGAQLADAACRRHSCCILDTHTDRHTLIYSHIETTSSLHHFRFSLLRATLSHPPTPIDTFIGKVKPVC